jgi:hypothetical protein
MAHDLSERAGTGRSLSCPSQRESEEAMRNSHNCTQSTGIIVDTGTLFLHLQVASERVRLRESVHVRAPHYGML